MAKKDIRTKILQAAIEVFGQNGVGTASLADVAKKAKISPPLLKYHFPTNKSLFQEIFYNIVEDLRSAVIQSMQKNSQKGLKAIEAYALVPLYWAKENPHKAALWMYFYHLASIDSTFSTLNKNVRDVGRDRISLLIYQAIEKGDIQIKKDRSVQDLAFLLQGVITAAPIMYCTEFGADLEKCKAALLRSIHDAL